MSRPEFPRGIILTSEMLRAISIDQKTYDEDPEEWERWERIKEEERLQEEQRLQERIYEEEQAELERIRERDGEDED